MNHSLYSSDRMTHLKIAVVGVVCAFVFLAVGLSPRIEQIDRERILSRQAFHILWAVNFQSFAKPIQRHGRLVALPWKLSESR